MKIINNKTQKPIYISFELGKRERVTERELN